MERRLAAILAADVVGYSRLMEIDEGISTDCYLQSPFILWRPNSKRCRSKDRRVEHDWCRHVMGRPENRDCCCHIV